MLREKIQTIGFRNIDNDSFPVGAHEEEKNTGKRNTVVQPLW